MNTPFTNKHKIVSYSYFHMAADYLIYGCFHASIITSCSNSEMFNNCLLEIFAEGRTLISVFGNGILDCCLKTLVVHLLNTPLSKPIQNVCNTYFNVAANYLVVGMFSCQHNKQCYSIPRACLLKRSRLRLVFSIQNLTRLVTSFLWFQNSIDQTVS